MPGLQRPLASDSQGRSADAAAAIGAGTLRALLHLRYLPRRVLGGVSLATDAGAAGLRHIIELIVEIRIGDRGGKLPMEGIVALRIYDKM